MIDEGENAYLSSVAKKGVEMKFSNVDELISQFDTFLKHILFFKNAVPKGAFFYNKIEKRIYFDAEFIKKCLFDMLGENINILDFFAKLNQKFLIVIGGLMIVEPVRRKYKLEEDEKEFEGELTFISARIEGCKDIDVGKLLVGEIIGN